MGFGNRTGKFYKFPFAGHDRFWFTHFFFLNRILGEVYKFCQFITGKVQRGRRINEQEYSVLSSLFRNQCPCPLQDDSSNAFNFQFYFFQSQIR